MTTTYELTTTVDVSDHTALWDFANTIRWLGVDIRDPETGAADVLTEVIVHHLAAIPGVTVRSAGSGLPAGTGRRFPGSGLPAGTGRRFPGNVGDFVSVLVGDRYISGAQLVSVDPDRRVVTVQFRQGALHTYDRNWHYADPIQSNGGRLYDVPIDGYLIEEPF